MADYISQAYLYLSREGPTETGLVPTLRSLTEGTLNILYALISILSIIFLQQLTQQIQDYSSSLLSICLLIFVLRQLSGHFLNESIKCNFKKAQHSIEYLLSRDSLAINYKHQGYDIGAEMMRLSNIRQSEVELIGSPYRKYLEEESKLQKIRMRNKGISNVLLMVASVVEFVLLFLLKVFKKNVDMWQFERILDATLFIKVVYLFGFQIIYSFVLKTLILHGQPLTINH